MTDSVSTPFAPNNDAKLPEGDPKAASTSVSSIHATHVSPSPRSTLTTGITPASTSSSSPVLHRESSSHIRRLSSSSNFSYNPSSQSSRRTSLITGMPIYGSHGDRDIPVGSSLGSPGFAPGSVGSEVGVGPGPGPQRYPKPRTAADLHLEMEQEQEAVVNRLTRELLRVHSQTNQQSSPSTSSAIVDDPQTPASARTQDLSASSYFIYGSSAAAHPRHQRTASATSTTNATAGNLSRQGSMRSIRSVTTGGRNTPPVGESPVTLPSSASTTLSPGILPTGWGFPPYTAYGSQQPISATGSELNLPLGDTPASATRSALSLGETIQLKKQMEQALQENEELRKRIKALEKQLRELGDVEPEGWGGRSASSIIRGRSRSPSVPRSIHRGRTREAKRPSTTPATSEPTNASLTNKGTAGAIATPAVSGSLNTTVEGNKGVSLLSEAFASAGCNEQAIGGSRNGATENKTKAAL